MSDFLIAPSGDLALRVTRSFKAPPARLRRAHLDPDLAAIWLASPDMPLELCQIDAQAGGSARYVWQMPDGGQMALSCTFESVADTCLIHRERFDPDWTGGEARVRTEFLDRGDGRTLLQVTLTYGDPATRDRVLQSGLTAAMTAGYDRLDKLL